ncbi:hypothetical protein TWF191_005123 [Orbilia oligospora]|uniref:Uncharacterized protein n=1 Tax=Orbilia oligospora TaxID=2813651 RepID=A0A7C8QTJ8_ORBOL|nr:hypothetical protein TWF191_005123 [Orbilia oligospora]
MKSIIGLVTIASAVSAVVIPFKANSDPFSLSIVSTSAEYNGVFISGAIQGEAYTAATISSEADKNFYFEQRPGGGILYHNVPMFGSSFGGDLELSLAATFSKTILPGQHLKPMTFQLKHDASGVAIVDTAMGFDSEGTLYRDARNGLAITTNQINQYITSFIISEPPTYPAAGTPANCLLASEPLVS